MRVAVAGGTGLTGRLCVEALERDGHEAVVLSRSAGVDLTTGEGLEERLAGVEAVIDATNTNATDRAEAEAFFGAATRSLLEAERRAGVRHHVLLSIAGLHRSEGNAHYAGKRLQESLVEQGPVPWTILPATQYFEFAEMVTGWTRVGDRATVPPARVQPLAAADAAEVLVTLALGRPIGRATELAGPERLDLFEMARRVAEARGDGVTIEPEWGQFEFWRGDALLPSPDAQIAPTRFDDWLARLR